MIFGRATKIVLRAEERPMKDPLAWPLERTPAQRFATSLAWSRRQPRNKQQAVTACNVASAPKTKHDILIVLCVYTTALTYNSAHCTAGIVSITLLLFPRAYQIYIYIQCVQYSHSYLLHHAQSLARATVLHPNTHLERKRVPSFCVASCARGGIAISVLPTRCAPQKGCQ